MPLTTSSYSLTITAALLTNPPIDFPCQHHLQNLSTIFTFRIPLPSSPPGISILSLSRSSSPEPPRSRPRHRWNPLARALVIAGILLEASSVPELPSLSPSASPESPLRSRHCRNSRRSRPCNRRNSPRGLALTLAGSNRRNCTAGTARIRNTPSLALSHRNPPRTRPRHRRNPLALALALELALVIAGTSSLLPLSSLESLIARISFTPPPSSSPEPLSLPELPSLIALIIAGISRARLSLSLELLELLALALVLAIAIAGIARTPRSRSHPRHRRNRQNPLLSLSLSPSPEAPEAPELRNFSGSRRPYHPNYLLKYLGNTHV
ncbi:hypothetical protein BJ508DRAFT_358381 [Ascobolus immersus RN42]|uniref:Uncharacterized protein n=1 Tax=Ascobolus immersus RN42 TaxID=1160509 RepID=A0A3N4INI6_ASCIM|nr:hypothetical protein BJ508DRAFT_358381 [Ascobolus immersus RN42]